MIVKWWITRTGDSLDVEGNFLDAVEANPVYFGTTRQDVAFAKSKGTDGELALFDQLCWDTEWEGEVVQPGAIFIEQTAEGLTIGFWRESYKMYERIMNWLSGRGFLGNTQVIMKEVGPGRGWRTDVRTLLSKPFAKNPDRRGNCPKCGNQLSWDEIVERGVCPKCKEKLA